MTYSFHPAAQVELDKAFLYYEGRQPGLGRRFDAAFEECLSRVLDNPKAWGVIDDGFRLCRLKKFPYGILYKIQDEGIVIVAVMHLHRRPGYWKDRVSDAN
jgi:plasmid stabilization system protein ParE